MATSGRPLQWTSPPVKTCSHTLIWQAHGKVSEEIVAVPTSDLDARMLLAKAFLFGYGVLEPVRSAGGGVVMLAPDIAQWKREHLGGSR